MKLQQTVIDNQQADEQPVPIRPYGIQELADFYHIKRRTFQRWVVPHKQAIGPRAGHLYTTRQVEIVFHIFGHPYIPVEFDEDNK